MRAGRNVTIARLGSSTAHADRPRFLAIAEDSYAARASASETGETRGYAIAGIIGRWRASPRADALAFFGNQDLNFYGFVPVAGRLGRTAAQSWRAGAASSTGAKFWSAAYCAVAVCAVVIGRCANGPRAGRAARRTV